MELQYIIELVHAGFTKEDIAQMISPVMPSLPVSAEKVPEAAPAAAAEAEPAAEPAAAAEPVPAAQPAHTEPVPRTTEPVQEPPQPSTADIMREIARLTSAVQANAIANSTMPQGISNPVKAEDVVAQIIRPTYPERSN